MYKMNNDAYETLKIIYLFSKIQVGLGAFENPFPAFTQGELDPQFASKDSYFGQNIEHVCISNWRVIINP